MEGAEGLSGGGRRLVGMVYGGWEEDGLKEGEGGGGGDALSGVTAAGSPKLQSLNRGTENLASPTARRMLGGEHAAVIVDVRIPATNNIENNGLSILVDRYPSSRKISRPEDLSLRTEMGKALRSARLGNIELMM